MALAKVAQDDSARVQDANNQQLAATPSEVPSRFRAKNQFRSQPPPRSSVVVSQQHMLVQGRAAAGQGLRLHTLQAEWAGSIADVVNMAGQRFQVS